ncbi:phasin family protein [Schnuerera sp. xch1]|uniref:phasin family protein n=1 Tax=Schnuerera sp. xch1 TaxID=2874283 RepID=UPI001CBB4979|nr:phasin family protein [Schnuerera sp. xch1]MBZ2175442.1 phasin family protein [Schnuerera sp. xch1]
MEELLKKVFLAGIGTLALTYEKANTLVDELVQKGQLTVDQGKQLNEELKRVINDNQPGNQNTTDIETDVKAYIDSLNLATKTDIDNLNNRIEELEKKL